MRTERWDLSWEFPAGSWAAMRPGGTRGSWRFPSILRVRLCRAAKPWPSAKARPTRTGTTTSWAERTLRMVKSAEKAQVATRARVRRPLRNVKRPSRWMVNAAMTPKEPAGGKRLSQSDQALSERRHEEAVRRFPLGTRAHEAVRFHEGPRPARRLRRPKPGRVCQEAAEYLRRLLVLQGTGGVDEPSARLHEPRDRREELLLPVCLLADVIGPEARRMSGWRPRVPRPVQERPEELAEKRRANGGRLASARTGLTLGEDQRRPSSTNVRSRLGDASAATTRPRPTTRSAIRMALPPGAAQASRARPGDAARWATSCDPWSCA